MRKDNYRRKGHCYLCSVVRGHPSCLLHHISADQNPGSSGTGSGMPWMREKYLGCPWPDAAWHSAYTFHKSFTPTTPKDHKTTSCQPGHRG